MREGSQYISTFRPSSATVHAPLTYLLFPFTGQYLYMTVFSLSVIFILVPCPCTRLGFYIKILKYQIWLRYYLLVKMCSLYSKLPLTVLTVSVQLRRCIKIRAPKAYASSFYLNR
jgi:hypothetical protein